MRPLCILAAVLAAAIARADVQLEATLAPLAGVAAPARGLALLTLRDDGVVRWELRVADLDGFATVTALRDGPAGPTIVALTNPPATGTHVGYFGPIGAEARAALGGGRWWLHVATAGHPAGAIHGPVLPAVIEGRTCACTAAASGSAFRACVREALRRLSRTARRAPELRAMKRATRAAACGPPTRRTRTGPGCCLPRTPASNVVVERLCSPRRAAACARLGGQPVDAACAATPRPCHDRF